MPQSTARARLFVGQLSFGATEEHIRELFNFYGHVLSVNVLYDKNTQRSRGGAFVEYGSTEEADCAIRAMHNRYHMEREKPLQVSYCERSELISNFGWQQAMQLHQENKTNPPPQLRGISRLN